MVAGALQLGSQFLSPNVIGPGAVVAAAAACVILFAGWRVVGREFAVLCAALAAAAFLVIGNPAVPVALASVVGWMAMRARIWGVDARRRAGPFARECLLIGAGLGAYTALRLFESEPEPALSNAASLVSFERATGSFFEPEMQSVVLKSEVVTRSFNWVYSFGFLAVTSAALLWLWFEDSWNFRLLRNSLGISALFAIITIALYPVAPPRLLADSGMVDTVVLFGREHGYANEFAAVPSLHVGWMAAVGFAIGASTGGRRGWFIGIWPALLMMVTVIVTGNHLWVDGIIGIAYVAVAILLVSRGHDATLLASVRSLATRTGAALATASARTWAAYGENPKIWFTTLSLGGLLSYLIVAQYLTPGFTDFWGYLTGQVAVFLVLLGTGEVAFSRQGGFSRYTHGIAAVCCYADVLGTDGNMYATIDEYDKLTHFAGVAAITAAAYDILRIYGIRRGSRLTSTSLVGLSVSIGFAFGVGWELYELIGDRVFNTARVGGWWDTSNDLASDALGAISLAVLLWLSEARSGEPQPNPGSRHGDSDRPADARPTASKADEGLA